MKDIESCEKKQCNDDERKRRVEVGRLERYIASILDELVTDSQANSGQRVNTGSQRSRQSDTSSNTQLNGTERKGIACANYPQWPVSGWILRPQAATRTTPFCPTCQSIPPQATAWGKMCG